MDPCNQPNPWGGVIRPCVRSLGHVGFHRDRLGAGWFVGGEEEGSWTVGTSGSAEAGHLGTTPPPPPTPDPPPTTREGELARQLDQEREAHARTHGKLVRALIQIQTLLHPRTPEGAQTE